MTAVMPLSDEAMKADWAIDSRVHTALHPDHEVDGFTYRWPGALAFHPVPYYTESLTAHLAITDDIERHDMQDAYLRALVDVIGKPVTPWQLHTATPRQRCLAFLKVMQC